MLTFRVQFKRLKLGGKLEAKEKNSILFCEIILLVVKKRESRKFIFLLALHISLFPICVSFHVSFVGLMVKYLTLFKFSIQFYFSNQCFTIDLNKVINTFNNSLIFFAIKQENFNIKVEDTRRGTVR